LAERVPPDRLYHVIRDVRDQIVGKKAGG